MIRTRWIVLAAVVVVATIGLLVYNDESNRSEAALDDLGAQQLAIARAAMVALDGHIAEVVHADEANSEPIGGGDVHGPDSPDHRRWVDSVGRARWKPIQRILGPLEQPSDVVVLVSSWSGTLCRLDGNWVSLPDNVTAALARGDDIIRIERADAPTFGLHERTAMMGVAHGRMGTVAVVATAEHQRDRDRSGRTRVVLSIVLAAAVMAAFTFIVWAKQRAESRLAVATSEQARDAELERLSRAATMAALGSGVAHELSTPLGVIVGRAEQIVARTSDERTTKAAQAIIDQAGDIDRVVRGLLGLARGAPIALEEVAPEAVVADTFALVRHRFERKGVDLVPTVADHVPAIRCEPLLLKHALVNLLLNACDASPAGSTVELEVTATETSVSFVVTDDGDGIPADLAARVIEPFYTTKPAGTGLGLAIASEIAKSHRGTLELAPRSPKGTRAAIIIPRAA